MDTKETHVRAYVRGGKHKAAAGEPAQANPLTVWVALLLLMAVPGFAVQYPAQTFTLALLAASSTFLWRKRWEILALRQGFVVEAPDAPESDQPRPKRSYKKRMTVNHYQLGKVNV